MGIEKDSQEQAVDVDMGPVIREQAYDEGYDAGWKARDEAASRNLKIAEDLAYDNGWIAGANAVISRKPYSALAGR